MDNAFRLATRLLSAPSWALHVAFWVVFSGFIALGNDFTSLSGVAEFLTIVFSYLVAGYGSYLSYQLAKKSNKAVLLVIGMTLFALCGAAIQYAQFMNMPNITLLNFIPISFFVGVLMVALKFAKDLFVHIQHEEQLKSTKLKMELDQLRSQVSPHFLFNTLNNLYGLAVAKSDLLPDLMIRLSALLRYTIYQAQEDKASLNEELEHLRNYIELEKMRLSDTSIVQCSLPDEASANGLSIGPMLLLIFVENAFKHSKNAASRHISIDIQIDGKKVILKTENSFGKTDSNENSGLGLANAQKRLQLLYPSKHQLKVNSEGNVFNVSLEIELS